MNQIPKCTLVPTRYYDEKDPRCFISEVSVLDEGATLSSVRVDAYDAVLVYEDRGTGLPRLYDLLITASNCPDYSKIIASIDDGVLSLVIAMGKELLLANVFEAPDFTTAEYYIFSVMKSLQLNPEVSAIRFMSSLEESDKMSLYRYFNSVESI